MPHRRLAACTALALTVAALTLATSHAARANAAPAAHGKPRFCHGHRATIVGTSGDDHLVGTPHRDVIVGLGGNDRIAGRGGNDILCGDGSRDRIHGGAGDDRLYGGTSADRLYGGEGDDRVYGGPGLGDYFASDLGNDTWITGLPLGADHHRDYFDYAFSSFHAQHAGGVTVDLPRGTAYGPSIGHDTLVLPGLDQGVKLSLTPNADTLTTGPGPDDVHDIQGGGTNRIDTGAGDDRVLFYDNMNWVSGDSTILLGAGNDVLYDSDDHPTVDAGPGDDHLSIDTFYGYDGAPDYAPIYGTADVTTGPGSDRVHLATAGGSVSMGDGDDLISYSVSAATPALSISGGDGVDTLDPGTGPNPQDSPHDTFTIDLGAGSAGWSSSTPSSVPDFENAEVSVIPGDGHGVVIRGTDGPNRLWYVPATQWDLPINSNPVTIYGLGGDDSLQGGNGDDTLDGGPGQDQGDGGDGNDTCVSIEGPLVLGGPTCEVTQ